MVSLGLVCSSPLVHPSALFVASPILALWLLPDFFKDWVNRRPVENRQSQLTPERKTRCALAGLRTWRYFREFSHAQYHWLIPDNVQEDPPQSLRAPVVHESGTSVECANWPRRSWAT